MRLCSTLGGLLLFFETRVHTVRNKDFYSPPIARVCATLPASNPPDSPLPTLMNMSLLQCPSLKFEQMKINLHTSYSWTKQQQLASTDATIHGKQTSALIKCWWNLKNMKTFLIFDPSDECQHLGSLSYPQPSLDRPVSSSREPNWKNWKDSSCFQRPNMSALIMKSRL